MPKKYIGKEDLAFKNFLGCFTCVSAEFWFLWFVFTVWLCNQLIFQIFAVKYLPDDGVVCVRSRAWHPFTWHRSWVTWTSPCFCCSPGRTQTTRRWGVRPRCILPLVPIRRTSYECYCGTALTSTPRLAYVLLDTALREWISEFAVRYYTTPDSAVSYLNHAQSA